MKITSWIIFLFLGVVLSIFSGAWMFGFAALVGVTNNVGVLNMYLQLHLEIPITWYLATLGLSTFLGWWAWFGMGFFKLNACSARYNKTWWALFLILLLVLVLWSAGWLYGFYVFLWDIYYMTQGVKETGYWIFALLGGSLLVGWSAWFAAALYRIKNN